MKKRIIVPTTEVRMDHWLDLIALADIEVTSEAASHPGSCSRNRNASRGLSGDLCASAKP
jgi:hypothetical protein